MELNKVYIAGNLTRDPELRMTPGGTAVCDLGLASNRRYRKQGDDQFQEETCFVSITVWGRQAETCNQYLSKGRQVLVEGRMNCDDNGNPRTFQRKDGSWGATYEVTAQVVRFLGGRSQAGSSDANVSEYDGPSPMTEEDIPF